VDYFSAHPGILSIALALYLKCNAKVRKKILQCNIFTQKFLEKIAFSFCGLTAQRRNTAPF